MKPAKPMLEVEEIEDDAPVLQAIDRLIKIAERHSYPAEGLRRPREGGG